jgi:hypothetical protein
VLRIKTVSTNPLADKILHYAHVDDVTQCYFFAIFYQIVIDTAMDQSEYMFPNWETAVKRTGETESKVSQVFNAAWQYVREFGSQYVQDIDKLSSDGVIALHEYAIEYLPECKGSHCGKKGGVQKLGDSFLPPQVSTEYQYLGGSFVSC